MPAIVITPLSAAAAVRDQLAGLLIHTVAQGGSVSFLHPLTQGAASAFWDKALTAAARGERCILGAWDGEALVGTVTLLLDMPQNQPHRAEIAKLMIRTTHRGRGIATALMREAERLALTRGRTLITLDTAADGGAGRLYEHLGFIRAGEIPDYALGPHGQLSATVIYFKRVPPQPA